MNTFFGKILLCLGISLSLLACREDTNCDSDYRGTVSVKFKTLKVKNDNPSAFDTVEFSVVYDSIYIKEYPKLVFDENHKSTNSVDLPVRESLDELTYVFEKRENGLFFKRELKLGYKQTQKFVSESCGIEYRYTLDELTESGFLKVLRKNNELVYPQENLWILDTTCVTTYSSYMRVDFKNISKDLENEGQFKYTTVKKSYDRIFIEEAPDFVIPGTTGSISSVNLPVSPDVGELTYVFRKEGQPDQKLRISYSKGQHKISDYCGTINTYQLTGQEQTNFYQVKLLKSELRKNTTNLWLVFNAISNE